MHFCSLFLVFVSLFLPLQASEAQTLTRIQTLDFGETTVRRNDAVYDITVSSGGGLSAGSNFDYVTLPQEGIYQLTGAAAFRPISVNITVDQQMIASGQQLTIDNFVIDAPASTDVNGEAIISYGARLRTNGNGTNYFSNLNFLAQMTLSVTIM